MVDMLVQRLACFFVILGVVVGNKPPEISQNKGEFTKVKT